MATRRPPKREGKPTNKKTPSRPARPDRKAQAPQARVPRSRQTRARVEPETDRLNKILASAGLGSRRAVEEYILQGRITVNGQVVRDLATRVDPHTARIELDGEPLKRETYVYFAVNKPRGYVSTNNDPAGRPRVVDLLPQIPQRVYTVGRLDENSNGLILLTNDGELANRLTHPRYGVEKVYHALVAGSPDPQTLDKLVVGIWLSDGKVRAKRVRIIGKRGDATMLEIILAEGKNREVRRMLAKLGHKVMSLTRVAVGPISVKGLKVGTFRPLTPREVGQLRQIAEGIAVPTAMIDPSFERREERGPGRGARGQARHERPAAGPARGRGESQSSSSASGATPPERPAGPRTARPTRPMGPRAGGRPVAKPAGTRRPPARPGATAKPAAIIPLPDESEGSTRKIIGLPGTMRAVGEGRGTRSGSARPRPPKRPGGPPRPRTAGPAAARSDVPPP